LIMGFKPCLSHGKAAEVEFPVELDYHAFMTSGYREVELDALEHSLEGELLRDRAHRILYATDASVYRQMPLAVARPRHEGDLIRLVEWAGKTGCSLVPRGAGTSLAGQAIGPGVVVDISRWMDGILEVDPAGRRARVQPGVIRDRLNRDLKETGLFFAPETSTTDRCTIGGMVGNNACGLHSLRYGSTREHVSRLRVILADGSVEWWAPKSPGEIEPDTEKSGTTGRVLRGLDALLNEPGARREILDGFPHPEIPRRNSGYALDIMAESRPYNPTGGDFNLCRLLCGSEGTLALVTEIELCLEPLPPRYRALMAVHLTRRQEAYLAAGLVLEWNPDAVEMMDHHILALAGKSPEQRENRFFVKGDPGAVLLVEFARGDEDALIHDCEGLESDLRGAGLGTYFPLLRGDDMNRAWALRRAGLGVLSRTPGAKRPVSVIEDSAVRVRDLPRFMSAVEDRLAHFGLEYVVHAHVGSGELHLRPMLDLHEKSDVALFRELGEEMARLVAEFRGSLSGEHGDGRLRAPWLPLVLGEANMRRLERIKDMFDPEGIFNPGKIVRVPPVDSDLRTCPGISPATVQTIADFTAEGGLATAVERCNGSAECRRIKGSPGTMCPSYRATREELHSTRGRANMLREFLVRPDAAIHPLDHPEVSLVMEYCLACKACRAECPSGVDMARLKGEVLQRRIDHHGATLSARAVAAYPVLAQIGMLWPSLANTILAGRLTGGWLRKILDFASQRPFPRLPSWREQVGLRRAFGPPMNPRRNGELLFLMDEFSFAQDAVVARAAIILLRRLGYTVKPSPRIRSGRTLISRGFLRRARTRAAVNVGRLSGRVSDAIPLVGIEPSTLLTFRDEYPDILRGSLREEAARIGSLSMLLEEFLARAMDRGEIDSRDFSNRYLHILYHGHCHQKALSSTEPALRCLGLPANYVVEEIESGCCGMGGVFGYERAHYDLSMRIGEEFLFKAVRSAPESTVIVSGGTGCRQQILDGTGRRARHPAEVLLEALDGP